MKINEKREGKVVVLGPIGRIDNETTPAFQSKLLDTVGPGSGAVLIDCSGVEYVSSAGLRALMMASKQSKAGNGRVAVFGLAPMVKEIFSISRFSLVVPVFETMGEALAAWR